MLMFWTWRVTVPSCLGPAYAFVVAGLTVAGIVAGFGAVTFFGDMLHSKETPAIISAVLTDGAKNSEKGTHSRGTHNWLAN